MPEFIALTRDAETQAIARTITQVLFDDLTFEREFALIPRDIYATIPAATAFADVPFDRWRELNADGLVIGTVQKTADRDQDRGAPVRHAQPAADPAVRLRQGIQRIGREPAPVRPHDGRRTAPDAARAARRRPDEARRSTSDRDGERMTGTIESRSVKEIYMADYDGENQRRLTVQKSLNITPTWSPDARSIAYSSYRRGQPNIFISNIYQGTLEELTKNAGNNFTPSWSPDGTRLCFASTRDGNTELYVVNRDGSNLRRLTNHPASDITPTWSPSGTQIAFTSDRTGTPQIYIVGADGLGLQKLTSEPYADRPTWSPAPFNEIAYSRPHRAGHRHQGHQPGDARGAAAHLWRRHERKPVVGAQRTAPRVHVDAVGQDADLHDGARRKEPETDHANRQQLPARLVEMTDIARDVRDD